jgi:hypothetical protein
MTLSGSDSAILSVEPTTGVVEEVRAALQDFVAPELRELRTRIEAVYG